MSKILILMLSGKSSCDGIGGFAKRYVAMGSLQRPLNNQILNYKSVLALCTDEIKNIIFFDISQGEIVCKELKDRFDPGKIVEGTQASHHFIP